MTVANRAGLLSLVVSLLLLLPEISFGEDSTAVAAAAAATSKVDRAECQMWAKLENKTLPLQNQGHANCSTNKKCTGFHCEGMYQEKELSFGMRVLPCQDPPGVEIYGYAPQFNTKNFSHVFKHKSTYTVPGAVLNLSMIPEPSIKTGSEELHGQLEVFVEKNPDGKSLVVGLTLKGCVKKTCVFSKPVFDHTKIPVPKCSPEDAAAASNVGKVNSVCRMSRLNECGENQMCAQQRDQPDIGLCECLPGYSQQNDGTCAKPKKSVVKQKLPHLPLLPAPEEATEEGEGDAEQPPPPPPHGPDKVSNRQPKAVADAGGGGGGGGENGGGGGAAAVVTASVIVVLVLVGAAAFVVLRTRLAPRLRARLTNTPYEDIVIGRQGRSESQQNVIA